MIKLPTKKLILPPEKNGGLIRLQRGIICATMTYGDADAFTYQLSNTSMTATAPDFGVADAELRYRTDGRVQELTDNVGGGTDTVFSESDPWSDDPSEDGSGHHIRLVSHDSGTNRYQGTPTLGSWVVLSTQRTFNFQVDGSAPPVDDTSTYTIGLSDDAGSSTLDTMTLTVRLIVGGF